jgi:excisionase family DNA binding protein
MILQVEIDTDELLALATSSPRFKAQLVAALGAVPAGIAAPDFYTAAEAAAVLGLSLKTIRRRIQAGLIPCVPGVRRTRIARRYIDSLANPNSPA